MAALSNDDLGRSGELQFEDLCTRGRLICNRSDRDRSGWDFVVEWSSDEGALDQRCKTICHVQVKTTTSNKNVALTLSAASLLAMSPHPALIVIFRVTPAGELLRSHLIHLLGAPLSKLLHRLRLAELKGRSDINKLKISFDRNRDGITFDGTADGLRSAIISLCGDDPIAYTAEKNHQLETLGYDGGGVFANALLQVDSPDQFSRILLGEEPFKPKRIEAFDVRFGIPIPYTGGLFDELEEILLTPPSAGFCEVAITGNRMQPAAIFRAELLIPPPIDKNVRMIVKHSELSFVFRETEVAFETTGTFTPSGRTLGELANILSALEHLSTGEAEISFTAEDGGFGPLTLPFAADLNGPYLEELPALSRIANDWLKLLQLAGTRAKSRVNIEDLWDTRDAQIAGDLILRNGELTKIAFNAAMLEGKKAPISAVMCRSAQIGDDAITCAVEVELRHRDGDPTTFVSTKFKPLEVRPGILDADRYLSELSERFGYEIAIHPDKLDEVDPETFELPWTS